MSNIIGIDVSKFSLDCAYLRDADQHKAKRKRVMNNPEGFSSLLNWAETVSGLRVSEIRFIIEPSSIYHELLVQFLDQHHATICLVSPGRVRKFAQGMGILSKNDLIDADMLTRYGLLNRKLMALGNISAYNSTTFVTATPITSGPNSADIYLFSVNDSQSAWAASRTAFQASDGGAALIRHFNTILDCNASLWFSQQVVGDTDG